MKQRNGSLDRGEEVGYRPWSRGWSPWDFLGKLWRVYFSFCYDQEPDKENLHRASLFIKV